MKQFTYRFNLIEIVLAVAVVGFGVVVILGMLPKGLRATQNANIEAYSSEVIDQLGGYLQQAGTAGVSAVAGTAEDEQKLISNFDEGKKGEIADKYISKYYSTLVWYQTPWQSFENGGNLGYFQRTNMSGVFKIRQDEAMDTEFGKIDKSDLPMMGDIYVIVMGNTLVDKDGNQEDTQIKVDFSGVLRVWKRPMEYQLIRLAHKGIPAANLDQPLPSGHDCIALGCADEGYYLQLCDDEKTVQSIPSSMRKSWVEQKTAKCATICMELSYPLSLPYKERTRRYYSFDVEKQN